jgi:hypothetical protein
MADSALVLFGGVKIVPTGFSPINEMKSRISCVEWTGCHRRKKKKSAKKLSKTAKII